MIADMLAPYANFVFDAPAQQSTATAWVGAVTYFLQLYFDFSGYSDMAIGLARMFSIRFPFNFNSPYKASTVIEYWSRWHMTLTRYITLYLYTPLSLAVNRSRIARGKKVSTKAARTLSGFSMMVAYPTIVAMFFAGIWHGAGLQFMIFGLIHGVCMTLEHAWRLLRPSGQVSRNPLLHCVSVFRVCLTVLIADIFFRSTSTASALQLLRSMIGLSGIRGKSVAPYDLWPFGLFLIVRFMPNTQQMLGETENGTHAPPARFGLRWQPSPIWAFMAGFALFLVIINLGNSTTFLYFQF